MEAATTLASTVGVQHACETLGVSRARFYRERSPQPPVRTEPAEGSIEPVGPEPDPRRSASLLVLLNVY